MSVELLLLMLNLEVMLISLLENLIVLTKRAQEEEVFTLQKNHQKEMLLVMLLEVKLDEVVD